MMLVKVQRFNHLVNEELTVVVRADQGKMNLASKILGNTAMNHSQSTKKNISLQYIATAHFT